MDLSDALRSTGAIRDYTEQAVPDDVLQRILDNARFAPNGGNEQAWRVVVVRDAAVRRQLRDLYLRGWYPYSAMKRSGLRPFSPVNDPSDEQRAMSAVPALAAEAAENPGFAEHLDRAPVLLALFADLSAFAATDRDLDRYSYVGGASVYPFAWSVLLAAHGEGLGGVLTTMAVRAEPDALELFGAQPPLSLAAVLALGYPVNRPRRLRRDPVHAFTTIDRIDGAPFRP
jgi:nitroreductase